MWFYFSSISILIMIIIIPHSSDQFNSECEKVSLAGNNNDKKFKIININQVTNKPSEMDGGHKTQLIEIDKLIINNGPAKQQQHGKASRSGVWHQVSKLSLFPLTRKKPSSNFYFSSRCCCCCCYKTFCAFLFALNECCGGSFKKILFLMLLFFLHFHFLCL